MLCHLHVFGLFLVILMRRMYINDVAQQDAEHGARTGIETRTSKNMRHEVHEGSGIFC